ncbi:uncharacterized protein CTRU02_210625 [Colletotrichum truncatum]|uniref:Uncharacterized protein n=1 Tax=Colletotrichum truncatum TaxID=5467 RepID=A0ACC3YPI3_COLTU|nr:uncharacterized protein CTRU02_03881 [Colletotrichum truncatum]KAF6796903.1 hypothetical protein CTRU02_03881 [Colletotrichum truncatum]
MGCRPSGSCFACKARKVKCDLQKPSCNRCTALGKVCPGYSDPWTAVHRQQNASAARQVQVRVAKRLKERGSSTHSVNINGDSPESQRGDSSEEDNTVKTLPAMNCIIQSDYEVYSVTHFRSNYTSAKEIAFFDVLLDLKPPSDSLDVFEEVVKATALASSSLQLGQPGMILRARQHYSKAIVKLGSALNDLNKAKDDSVVVALLTMGLYDAILPEQTPARIASRCRGSLALLRYRAEHGLATSLDRSSLAFVAHLATLETFIGHEGRSPILMALTKAEWAPGGIIEPLLARTICYKDEVQKILSNPDVHGESVEYTTSVFKRGIRIIRDLEVAANYRITSPSPRSISSEDGLEDYTNTFNNLLNRNSDTGNAIAKGLYLTVRLHIIEQIFSLPIALGQLTREQLRTLADLPHGLTALEQVCEQIRVVFGFDGRVSVCKGQGLGFQAWCMFWPLIATLNSSFVDKQTRLWCMDKISMVSQASGFGLAMYQMGWFTGGPTEIPTTN